MIGDNWEILGIDTINGRSCGIEDLGIAHAHIIATVIHIYEEINDFPSIAHALFFKETWRAPLKVNMQSKVNKVKTQFMDF